MRDNRLKICGYPIVAPAASNYALSAPVSGNTIEDLIPDLLFYVMAAALNVSQLPNGATLTFTFIECSDIALSSVISSTVMGVQTGASGTGAAAAIFACQPKYAGGQYMGLRIDASSTANVGGSSYTLAIAKL